MNATPAPPIEARAAPFIESSGDLLTMPDFECFCGDTFGSRDQLIEHNVEEHEMSRAESERKVEEKYPMG